VASSNRYRRHLAAERDAAAVYRALAAQREGEEAAMFARLAEAEDRHAAYWRARLGETDVRSHRLGLRARALSWMARRVGSLIVLSLLQRAELRNEYQTDAEAPTSMAADEQVHARVVAGLARRRRAQASGPFRAAVFGVNDGLVSNLSLVLGIAGSGAESNTVALTGLAGLLAGALSMAAGEYVSVRSQRELVESTPGQLDERTLRALRGSGTNQLVDALRAEGWSEAEAKPRAEALLAGTAEPGSGEPETDEPGAVRAGAAEPEAGSGEAGDHAHAGSGTDDDAVQLLGSGLAAGASSFLSFALGAIVPVAPYLVGSGGAALLAAFCLTGVALFIVGGTSGVIAGGPVRRRGLRQLAIGALAAAVTYGVGSVLGVTLA
jgi:VIT1/CCC1 family predicted Fe2+/Mn2+ transporter